MIVPYLYSDFPTRYETTGLAIVSNQLKIIYPEVSCDSEKLEIRYYTNDFVFDMDEGDINSVEYTLNSVFRLCTIDNSVFCLHSPGGISEASDGISHLYDRTILEYCKYEFDEIFIKNYTKDNFKLLDEI